MQNNLRELRKARGLSQKQLCDNLAKSGYFLERSTYSKYETGSRNIPNGFLVYIARYYSTTADYILKLTEKQNRRI